jgi:hypothetical protein
MDGERMRPGTQAGQVEVTGSAPVKVTWHFAPTSDATHQFVVRYRVQGVVRKENADTIYWPAIPEEHEYAIDRSAITLTYPAAAQPIEPPTLNRPHKATPIANDYRLTTTDISSDEGVYLTARFAAGTATTVTSQWQIKQQQAEALGARTFPIGLLAAVVMLLIGGLGLYLYARTQRRESIKAAATLVTTPPAEIEPALAAKLTEHSQGYMGTLFALAQRGVLEVHEEKGWWNSKKYILDWKNPAAALSAHERGLLSLIFKTGETTIDMSAIPSRLMTKYKVCDEPLEREMIDRGWLDPERKRQRTRLIALGFVLMLGGLGLFMLGALGSGVTLANNDVQLAPLWAVIVGIGASAFILSIALLIYGASFSALTMEGEAETVRWKSFEKYLKQISESKQPDVSADTFERYLPLAATFGLGGAWAKHFQSVGGAPLPVWFQAMPDSDGDFSAIIAVMVAADFAASSGGGDGGSSGGGGASGAG